MALLFAMMHFSCCTMINTTKQQVLFDSDPKGAKIIVNNATVGVKPLNIELLRKNR